jgi:hypothetical protein
MSREEMTGADEPRTRACTDVDAEGPSSLAHIDALAVSKLSTRALARYQAYRKVLIAREQDEAAVRSTLSLFVWDLSDNH